MFERPPPGLPIWRQVVYWVVYAVVFFGIMVPVWFAANAFADWLFPKH